MSKFKNKKSMLALYNKQEKNGKLRDGVDYWLERYQTIPYSELEEFKAREWDNAIYQLTYDSYGRYYIRRAESDQYWSKWYAPEAFYDWLSEMNYLGYEGILNEEALIDSQYDRMLFDF